MFLRGWCVRPQFEHALRDLCIASTDALLPSSVCRHRLLAAIASYFRPSASSSSVLKPLGLSSNSFWNASKDVEAITSSSMRSSRSAASKSQCFAFSQHLVTNPSQLSSAFYLNRINSRRWIRTFTLIWSWSVNNAQILGGSFWSTSDRLDAFSLLSPSLPSAILIFTAIFLVSLTSLSSKQRVIRCRKSVNSSARLVIVV